MGYPDQDDTCHNCGSYNNNNVICDDCIFGVVDNLRAFVDQQRAVAAEWRSKQNSYGNDRAIEITAHCDGVMRAVVAIESLLPLTLSAQQVVQKAVTPDLPMIETVTVAK